MTTPDDPNNPDTAHISGYPGVGDRPDHFVPGGPPLLPDLDPDEVAFYAARDRDDALALAEAASDPQSWWNRPPTHAQWWAGVATELARLGIDLTERDHYTDLALGYLVSTYGQDSVFHIDISERNRTVVQPGGWPSWAPRRSWDPQHVARTAYNWTMARTGGLPLLSEPSAPALPVSGEAPEGGPRPDPGAGPERTEKEGPSLGDARREAAEWLLAWIETGEAMDEWEQPGLVEVTLSPAPDSTGRWTETYGPYPSVVHARTVAAAIHADPVRYGFGAGSSARAVALYPPSDLDGLLPPQ